MIAPRIERYLVDGLFYLLLAAVVLLAGWLGARLPGYWDWTGNARHTLDPDSARWVARLEAPLRVTVFLPSGHPLARRIDPLLARYRQAGARLKVGYVDPQLFPEQARAAEVSALGQIQLEYRNRRETLDALGEEALTAAIARLVRLRPPWIWFLEGHGERRPDGESGSDLKRFAAVLQARGYRLQTLDLTREPGIPKADLLVLSTPAIALFPGEARQLREYVAGGGSLLWLMDPGALNGLEGLVEELGLQPLPGLVVDTRASSLGIEDPQVAVVEHYPDHALVRGLTRPGLFPGSLAYRTQAAPGWTLETSLRTGAKSWNETGPIRGEIQPDSAQGEQTGPLALALALSRARQDHPPQRLVVVGDGDFLSNAQLGNGANLALGLRLLHWLTAPEDSEIGPPPAPDDRHLALNRTAILLLGGGSLVVLPLLLLVTGLVVRRRRLRA